MYGKLALDVPLQILAILLKDIVGFALVETLTELLVEVQFVVALVAIT